MFKNRVTTTISLMVIGFIIGMILQALHIIAIAWFFLPLAILIISLLSALASKGKGFKYTAWFIGAVIAYVLLTPGLFRHYPLIVLAAQNRDAQNERDVAGLINSPFAKSNKILDLYDAKVDNQTADTLAAKLFDENGNPKDSTAYKQGFNKLKSEAQQYRHRKDERVQIDTLINPKPKVQQNSTRFQLNNTEEGENIDVIEILPGKGTFSSLIFTEGSKYIVLDIAGDVKMGEFSKNNRPSTKTMQLYLNDLVIVHMPKDDKGKKLSSSPLYFLSIGGGIIKIKRC